MTFKFLFFQSFTTINPSCSNVNFNCPNAIKLILSSNVIQSFIISIFVNIASRNGKELKVCVKILACPFYELIKACLCEIWLVKFVCHHLQILLPYIVYHLNCLYRF
jgi:hypothetical protein